MDLGDQPPQLACGQLRGGFLFADRLTAPRSVDKAPTATIADGRCGPSIEIRGHRRPQIHRSTWPCSATTDPPPSSPPSYPRKVGTRPSPIPRSPTLSATGSCITLTSSRCAAPRCEKRKGSAPRPAPDKINLTIPLVAALRSCAQVDWNGCPSRAGTRAQVGRNTQQIQGRAPSSRTRR